MLSLYTQWICTTKTCCWMKVNITKIYCWFVSSPRPPCIQCYPYVPILITYYSKCQNYIHQTIVLWLCAVIFTQSVYIQVHLSLLVWTISTPQYTHVAYIKSLWGHTQINMSLMLEHWLHFWSPIRERIGPSSGPTKHQSGLVTCIRVPTNSLCGNRRE